LVLILDVYPPEDETVNKWDACDHEKLIKVFKGLTIYFDEIVHRVAHLGTIALQTISPELFPEPDSESAPLSYMALKD
jgi:hypothetical protein